MPQEYDAATGNAVLQEAPRSDPGAVVNYRSGVSAADGTAKPAPGSTLWIGNPGFRGRARVFVETTGSPAACTVRAYLRCGGVAGHSGTASVFAINGSPNYDLSFDVTVDGDDLAVLVETLSGGTSPTVSIFVSWR
ncbi:MAG: hypothetical protein ACYDCQ_08560 [Dehalococcoidia bacterium]